MVVKAGILGGNKGQLHLPGNFRKVHPLAVLAAIDRFDGVVQIIIYDGVHIRIGDLVDIQLCKIWMGDEKNGGSRSNQHHQKREK